MKPIRQQPNHTGDWIWWGWTSSEQTKVWKVTDSESSLPAQRIAFEFGYKWLLKRDQVERPDIKCIILDSRDKTISPSMPESSLLSNIGCTHNPEKGVLEQTREWLKFVHPKEEIKQEPTKELSTRINLDRPKTLNEIEVETKQPETIEEDVKAMSEPQPPSNPYEVMIQDITNRVYKMVGKAVDENRVKEMINNVLSTQGRTLITIEDRRKQPPLTTDINKPTHKALPDVIGVLKSGCWCVVVGPTGGGKTLGAFQYAKAAGIKIVGIKQLCNTLAPHELIGFIDANGKYRKGAWTDSILGQIWDSSSGAIPNCDEPHNEEAIIVIDEMDNGNPNIIMLVKALATGYIMMPYGKQKINPNLQVMATMNTWGMGANREYVGRMAQDAAMLNEFQFVEWNYDEEFEWQLVKNTFNEYGGQQEEYTMEHMQMIHSMFLAMRKNADTQKIRCIISTRNIINTVKLLLCNTTWTIHKALKMTIYKGLKEEEIKRVEAPEHWRWKPKAGSKVKQQVEPTKVELKKPSVKDCPI